MDPETEKAVGPKMPAWWAQRYSGEAAHGNALQTLIDAHPSFNPDVIRSLYVSRRQQLEAGAIFTHLNPAIIEGELRRLLKTETARALDVPLALPIDDEYTVGVK